MLLLGEQAFMEGNPKKPVIAKHVLLVSAIGNLSGAVWRI